MVWRTLDGLVSIGALVLAGLAISEGADPLLTIGIAATIITGPKALEWILVREDYVEFERTSLAHQDREDED